MESQTLICLSGKVAPATISNGDASLGFGVEVTSFGLVTRTDVSVSNTDRMYHNFYVLLTVHLGTGHVNNQIDALF